MHRLLSPRSDFAMGFDVAQLMTPSVKAELESLPLLDMGSSITEVPPSQGIKILVGSSACGLELVKEINEKTKLLSKVLQQYLLSSPCML